jgi:KDO2-lipid IV(A) lauroyltransferase
LRSRSTIRNRAEYTAVRLMLALLRWAPRPLAASMARGCAQLLDRLVPKMRRVGLRNLEFALPELSPEERHRIIDGVFRSIARIFLAVARFPGINRENVHDWIRRDGFEHFERALARGKGVLFATAHLGNWELGAFAHSLMKSPINVVVRPLDNPLLDALVEKRRRMSGNNVFNKRDLARPILKALARNETVGILMDQNASLAEGVFVDFFGRKACVHQGFVKLAARSGAAVIPSFALWSEEEQSFVVKYYPPLEMTGDAAADTQTVHTKLEEIIREYPDQWLWIHRRWKTRPPGEPPIY